MARSQSAFVAQMIACAHDLPQMRERRRASLDETLAAYAVAGGRDDARPLVSQLA